MKHPILSSLGFDNRDIKRLSLKNEPLSINEESISTFVLGTILNTIDSTYCNTPIFNLKNLDEKGLLDLNSQSASKDELVIKMSCNKTAATSSSKCSSKLKFADNLLGVLGSSISVQHEQSLANANSDGNVYVTMQRGKNGSYYQINARDLKSGLDFTPFLIGEKLTDHEIMKYINYSEKKIGGKKYISELHFNGYENSGLIEWGERNFYGNIQLLAYMETLFVKILAQYAVFENDDKIKEILYAHLFQLKYEKINHAIKDFYAHVGTHFVTKLYFSNYVNGSGILKSNDSSSNKEQSLGAAVSINGSIPTKFSMEMGAEVSFAHKNGWADSMKDLYIEVESHPSIETELSQFASDIKAMLNKEDSQLSVPSLKIPDSPKVELLDKPKVEDEKIGPPESVFSSYADWKQYQADIKKDKEGKNKATEETKKADKELKNKGLEILLEKDPQTQINDGKTNLQLYEAYKQEITHLKETKKSIPPTITNGSLLRIDNMFVSNFESIEYEAVIPPLRLNKLMLPGKKEEIDPYPNISKLFLVINLFQQLSNYVKFSSNFSVSNIPSKILTGIQDFLNKITDENNDDSYYKLIKSHMLAGKDIDSKILAGWAEKCYGDNNSLLYQSLQDIDKFNYIKYLLKPDVMYIWREAPGGYAPVTFNQSSQPAFAAVDKLIYIEENRQYKLDFNTSKLITEMPEDFSQYYDGSSSSPFYPIFRYELKNEPKFLFLQLVGRYQLIYGRNRLIHPCYRYNLYSHGTIDLKNNTLKNIQEDTQNHENVNNIPNIVFEKKIGEKDVNLISLIEGFQINKINRDYALYFPDKTQSKELREKSRVIQIGSYNIDKSISFKTLEQNIILKDKKMSEFHPAYGYSNLYYSIIQQFEERKGILVKIEDGSQKELGSNEKFPLLIPIDYSKVQEGRTSLLMGSSFGVDNLINSPTYDSAINISVH